MELILVSVACVFSVLGFAFGAFALVEVKAMQRSTHRITLFDPSTQEFSNLTDDQKKRMTEPVMDNF